MLKYLLFILVVMFSQIKGGEIIHTELHKNGGIKLVSYYSFVNDGMGITKVEEETYDINGRKIYETTWYEDGQKKRVKKSTLVLT